jgi:hypothetical protein
LLARQLKPDRYVSPTFRKLLLSLIAIGISEFYRKCPPLIFVLRVAACASRAALAATTIYSIKNMGSCLLNLKIYSIKICVT